MLWLRQMKIVLLAIFLGLVVGCGSSSSSNDGVGDSLQPETEISGLVEVPGGNNGLASLTQPGVLDWLIEGLVPSAFAATGMEPVAGAVVELIRIDNNGEQVGDVLANTTTSITGTYSLLLPAGMDLSGDLIVRVTGFNEELRAQVVEQAVNINPVTEFVLQRFIDNGTELNEIKPDSVVRFRGRIEEFDLTMSEDPSSLSAMLEELDKQVGAFADDVIATIKVPQGDSNLIAGEYNLSELSFGVHEGHLWNNSLDLGLSHESMTFVPKGDGIIERQMSGDEGIVFQYAQAPDRLHTEITLFDPDEEGSIDGEINAEGTLSYNAPFDEWCEEDKDVCFRMPPFVHMTQKVKDKNILVERLQDSVVRYGITDVDGVETLNPNDLHGVEVFRGIGINMRKPDALELTDLQGVFGAVSYNVAVNSDHKTAIEMVISKLQLGDGVIESDDINSIYLQRNDTGVLTVSRPEIVSNSMSFEKTDNNGRVDIHTDTDAVASMNVNDEFDVLVQRWFDAGEGQINSGGMGYGIALKLREDTPSLSGKTYRLMTVGMRHDAKEFAIFRVGYNTLLTMDSQTEGRLVGKGYTESVTVDEVGDSMTSSTEDIDASVTVSFENGVATLEVDGETEIEGFFNADANMGVFRRFWEGTGDKAGEMELELFVLAELEEVTAEP